MVASEESGNGVRVNQNCVSKLIQVFTEDPHSIEKCMWDTFEQPGDVTSPNTRLEDDYKFLRDIHKDELFRNPDLFIDG